MENPHPENAITDWDLDKLKKVVVALKKKQELTEANLNDSLEENKILKGQQNLLKQLLEQAHQEHEKTRAALEHQASDPYAFQKLDETAAELRNAQAALRKVQQELASAKDTLEAEKAANELQKNRLEKFATAIKERDKRIGELQQYETSFRKALDQKQHTEAALEQESFDKRSLTSEKEKAIQELAESKQHSEQLQRVVQHLRERQEEAILESNQLKEEFQHAQQTIALLKQEYQNAQSIVDQAQNEGLSAQRCQRNAEDELQALQEQFKQLKARTIAVQQELQNKERALISAYQIIDQIKFDRQNLQREMEEKRPLEDQLQNALASLTALQRLSDEQQETLASFQLQDEAWQRHNATLEQALEAAHQQLREQTAQLEERYYALEDQYKLSLVTIKSLEGHAELYQKAIEDRDEALTSLNQSVEELKTAFQQSESLYLEKDNALKLSHHHLAKKVKECTLLAEKNREHDELIAELQNALTKTSSQLEEQRVTAQKQEEQLLDAKKQSDEHIRNWEKKYFEIYEHLQNSERRIQTMQHRLVDAERKLEKYVQLEVLLKNLSSGSSPSVLPPDPAPTPMKAPPPPPEPLKESPPPFRQESLFENPNANHKRKEHLFD